MPPKVPKKMPPWIALSAEFIKKNEHGRDVKQAVDLYTTLLTKHWEAFVEKTSEENGGSERPAKKRNVDPIKTMGNAMNKVAQQVEEAKDNQPLLQQYQERVKSVIPDAIKSTLSAVVGDETKVGGAGSDDLTRLIQETSQNLNVLAQKTQKVFDFANVSHSNNLRQDAESAVQKITQNIEELREVISN